MNVTAGGGLAGRRSLTAETVNLSAAWNHSRQRRNSHVETRVGSRSPTGRRRRDHEFGVRDRGDSADGGVSEVEVTADPGRPRRGSRDRGSASVTVLMIPFIIVGMMAVVQFGIAAYARQVVAGAAQDGADTAARHNSSVAAGQATADGLVLSAGGHLMSGYSSSGSSDGEIVTIRTQADVVKVFPLFPTITVRGAGSASIERFEPAGP